MHRPNHSSIHSDSTLIQTTEKLRSKLTKSSITVVLLALIGAPLGYGIRMILSRTLEPEMFGLMYAVIALFALLSEYNDLGFGYSVSYLIPKFLKKNQIKKVWNTFLYDLIIESGTAFFISLLIIIFGKLLATYYFKTPVAVPMLSIGLIFFISHSITSAFKKFFIGIQRERIYSSIDVFYYLIVFTATVLLFANSSTDIISYFFYWSFSYLIVSLGVMAIFILKHRDIVSRPTWDSSLFKRMFSFAVPTLLTTTIGTILKSAD
ncbi:MAG: oligosaccharide flippase family protein, partial [Candidatus Pacebacteria bacterium]|nr:oligosaccharide flippase family protein [Candidatus Paceibacterota bacterium]